MIYYSMLDALLRKGVVHFLAISVLGFIAYSNTFNSPFHLDDIKSIVNNPIVKDFGYFLNPCEAKGFESYGEFRNRYVGYLTFGLNYGLHGLNVTGYHIFNLALHVFNSFLVYWLVVLTFRTPLLKGSSLAEKSEYIALFAGSLFVSHPIQTQAVTYIVQRFACLVTTFYVLSLGFYIRWRIGKLHKETPMINGLEEPAQILSGFVNYASYFLSILFAALAMKTKQIAFTLPIAVSLYEFMFFRDILKKRALYLMPLLLLMLLIPLSLIDITIPVEDIVGDMDEATRISKSSRVDYMLTELRVMVTYLRLFALPVRQNLYYDYPAFHSFFDWQTLLSSLFLSGIVCLAVFLYYRSRIIERRSGYDLQESNIHVSRIADHSSLIIAFGIFWFFLTLSIESSIVPLHPIYEHRAYLPSAGVFMAVATLSFLAVDKWRLSGLQVLSSLTALIVVFSAASYTRNSVWQNETSLWEDTARKSPHKAKVQNNLGSAYISAGMFDKAEKHLNIAIALKPDYASAHNNLGLLYSAAGQTEKAIKHQMAAIVLDPEFPGAHYDLGNIYMAKEMPERAVEHYREAVRLNPGYAEAHTELGTAYFKMDNFDMAEVHFMTAIRLKPDYAEAYNGLGNTSLINGKLTKALEQYSTALKLKNDYAEAHFNIGVVYLMRDSTERAEDHFYQASILRPDLTDSRFNLGVIYLEKGQKEKAMRAFEYVLKINPEEDKAREYLEKLRKESH